MSFKGVSIFSSGGHFAQQSRTILAFLVEDHPKKYFCEIILKLVHWYRRRRHLKVFPFFLTGSHFIKWSRMILAILVEGHPRNISVTLFGNQAIGVRGDVI